MSSILSLKHLLRWSVMLPSTTHVLSTFLSIHVVRTLISPQFRIYNHLTTKLFLCLSSFLHLRPRCGDIDQSQLTLGNSPTKFLSSLGMRDVLPSSCGVSLLQNTFPSWMHLSLLLSGATCDEKILPVWE